MRYIAKTNRGGHLIELTNAEFHEFKKLMEAAKLVSDYGHLHDGDMQQVLHALNSFAKSTIVIDKMKIMLANLSELLLNPTGEKPSKLL